MRCQLLQIISMFDEPTNEISQNINGFDYHKLQTVYLRIWTEQFNNLSPHVFARDNLWWNWSWNSKIDHH